MKSREIPSPAFDGSWSRWLVREPLVHFLVLGGLLVSPAVEPRNPRQQAERLSVPAAYLVGTVAMFWVFERTYSFLA